LLSTYEVERKEHVRELTSRIKNIGKLVSERNFSKAVERDQRLREDSWWNNPKSTETGCTTFFKKWFIE
jgi:hypothetical protein